MTSTNPYEAPSISLEATTGPATEGPKGDLHRHEAAVLVATIAISGAVFGAGVGFTIVYSLGLLLVGMVVGLLVAFVPAVTSVFLCANSLPRLINFASDRAKIVAVGFTSGALAGFFSAAMLLLIDSDVSVALVVISALSTTTGALGGLSGAFIIVRFLRDN